MITLPAMKVNQFGMSFYQVNLSAREVEKLVGFEVLSYPGQAARARKPGRRSKSRVNWELLETRISRSEAAYQRPVIRKKIEELTAFYQERMEHRDLPAIPGSVLLVAEKPLAFTPLTGQSTLGELSVPEEEGSLRTLDGQHRLLALHGLAVSEETGGDARLKDFQVPAVIFDALRPPQTVEMFVTINAKHTRLKSDMIVSLSGRKLYPDRSMARAHDIIRRLNEFEESPLFRKIRILGVGPGKVSQAPLAAEMEKIFLSFDAVGGGGAEVFFEKAPRFFLNYFKQIEKTFPTAWHGRKYSILTGTALRAFLRVVPEVIASTKRSGEDFYEFHAIGRTIEPWKARLGDRRFETEGEWKAKAVGGGARYVDQLAGELRDSLSY